MTKDAEDVKEASEVSGVLAVTTELACVLSAVVDVHGVFPANRDDSLVQTIVDNLRDSVAWLPPGIYLCLYFEFVVFLHQHLQHHELSKYDAAVRWPSDCAPVYRPEFIFPLILLLYWSDVT